MRKLTDFNNFMFNKLMEELNVKVNELELVLSQRLKNILLEIDHKIAHDLLALHMDAEQRDFKKTFIDLGSKPDMVSFIQSNKVPELIEPEIVHGTFTRNPNFQLPPNWAKQPDERTADQKAMGEFELVDDEWTNPWIQDINHIINLHEIQFADKNHPVWHKNRAEVKVGRFISQMFPDKYPANVKREDRPKIPDDVESFVNMYVATVESKSKMIVSVKGEEIKSYYNCSNYFKQSGTLGGSCMKDPSKGEAGLFDIYTQNTDKVQMLILYPEDIRNKIIGRAILWKLSKVDEKEVEDKYFMDRIYTASDSDEFMYIEYAKANKYYYKSQQSYGADYNIVHPDGESKRTMMEVDLKPESFDRYPYMDTMQFYNPKTGHLSNDQQDYRSNEHGVMTDTGGSINFYR